MMLLLDYACVRLLTLVLQKLQCFWLIRRGNYPQNIISLGKVFPGTSQFHQDRWMEMFVLFEKTLCMCMEKPGEKSWVLWSIDTPLTAVTLMLSLTCDTIRRGEYKFSFSELLNTILRKKCPLRMCLHTHTHNLEHRLPKKVSEVTTPGGERGRLPDTTTGKAVKSWGQVGLLVNRCVV